MIPRSALSGRVSQHIVVTAAFAEIQPRYSVDYTGGMTHSDGDVTALDSVINRLSGNSAAKSISTLTGYVNGTAANLAGVATHLRSHGTFQMAKRAMIPPGTVRLTPTICSDAEPLQSATHKDLIVEIPETCVSSMTAVIVSNATAAIAYPAPTSRH